MMAVSFGAIWGSMSGPRACSKQRGDQTTGLAHDLVTALKVQSISGGNVAP